MSANFYMMMGLPASGKSTIANTLSNELIVHSSDALRKELYGNENNQENNNEIFLELHKRIKEDLRKGRNVVYDATNISKKRRKAFLQELKHIECTKFCICMMKPYKDCLKDNAERDRVVPVDVIKNMYINWCPPDYSEGFDYIEIVYPSSSNLYGYNLTELFNNTNGIDNFNQENKHHKLTLGGHCRKALSDVFIKYPDRTDLHIAALLHDCGKPFVKTKVNAKGIDDGDSHYYQHHCVSAYDSFFYTKNLGLDTDSQIYIANLIYFHMHPYRNWAQTTSQQRRFKIQFGEEMFRDIMILHEADVAAH